MLRRFAACATAIAVYALTIFGPALDMAYASQNALSSPTTGTVSGLGLSNNYNNAIDSLNTNNSGSSAPSNQLTGSPSAGNGWDDNSVSGWIARRVYDGADWLVQFWLDTTNHLYTGIVGGGAINSVASATSTDLCSVNPAYLTVTGTTTITGFGSTCQTGVWKRIKFSGILTLTYNATSLIVPTAGNITTAAGDTADAVALGSGNWIVTAYHRASGSALSTVGLNIGAAALGNSALSALSMPVNLQLATSVGSNNLTLSVCTINSGSSTCNNASSTNPILFAFRDATPANGDPVIISLQAALSFTIGSGNTMGCANGVDCLLHLYAINEGGTIALCAYNAVSGSSIVGLNEGVLQETGSGTGGGSSAQVLYCGTASTGTARAIRDLGYIEITESTAGTWSANATIVQLMGPGVPKAGQIVQRVYNSSTSGSSATASGYTVSSSSAPAPAAGVSVIAQAIVPTSAASVLRIHVEPSVAINDGSGGNIAFLYLYNGSATVQTQMTALPINVGNTVLPLPLKLQWSGIAGGTASQTYTAYLTSDATNLTCYINETDYSGTVKNINGGTGITSIEIEEIHASLERPANDNVNPGVIARAG